MKKRRMYWAYGSNLCERSMAVRCPGATKIGPLTISGALVFRGVADVEPRSGSQVAGGLWWVTTKDEAALDQYEGVDSGLYTKEYLKLRTRDGKVHRCLYYKMRVVGVQPPSEAYLDKIIQGYKDFGLDLALLDQAVMASWSDKKVTKRLRKRHERRGSPRLAQPTQLFLA